MGKYVWTAAAGVLLLSLLAGAVWLVQAEEPYAPDQPIAFDHKVHVTDYNIQCFYCHSYVDRSPFAGVPSVDRCMGCHLIVARDSPEIEKLRNYQQNGEPVPWIKVYALPRFVHFNHEAHVRAEVQCQACHGAVESMTKVTRVQDLQMGWCLDCHRSEEASVDCLTCHY